MKKIITIFLMVALVAVGVFAAEAQADTSKYSVGVSFGTGVKAYNFLEKGEYGKLNVRYGGFTMDVRGDYQATDKVNVVAILSWDIPAVAKVRYKGDFFARYADVAEIKDTEHYLGLYVGAGYDVVKTDKFAVNVSVGHEFDLNLNEGKFDGLVAAAVKASYAVTDKITIDAHVRGGIAWLANGEIVKKAETEIGLCDMFVSTNKVTLGATYKF